MVAATHHTIHVPDSIVRGVHTTERAAGALFFALLAPVLFALTILSGLLLALGLGAVL